MDITGNPFVVTAADVAAGPVTLWTGVLYSLEFEFVNYTNTTDTCIILQSNGKPAWQGKGAADLETVRSGLLPGPFRGLSVAMGGITATGTVLIYHK